MKMGAMDLFCLLVGVFALLVIDAMVAVKHYPSVVQKLQIEHAELKDKLRTVSQKLSEEKQGLASTVRGFKKDFEELEQLGKTIMRLKRNHEQCKSYSRAEYGVSDVRGRDYKVLVKVNEHGRQTSYTWTHWCFPRGYDETNKPSSNSRTEEPTGLFDMIREYLRKGEKLLQKE